MNDSLPLLISFVPATMGVAFFAYMWWKDFGFTKRQRISRGYRYRGWKEARQQHNSGTFDRLRRRRQRCSQG